MTEKKDTNRSSADPKVNVIGLRVNVGDLESTAGKVLALAAVQNGGYVCVSTVHMAMEARDDRRFSEIVNRADLVTADGMPILWMQKLRGRKEADRVRGTDLMLRLFALAEAKNLSVGFYGGRAEVLEKIAELLKKDHPGLKISYLHSPPFRPLSADEDAAVTAEIEKSGTDILFVGLGCPKQERWMAAHRNKLTTVMLGVGAAFDFYAGNISEAPRWLSSLGLEWLYRLSREPRRLWRRYLFLNPRFVILAGLQLLGLKKFKGEKVKR
ncbi:MAG: WecB/TagA/CpsF family glycosyltransferase [Pyrinomonadaceae bacterium]